MSDRVRIIDVELSAKLPSLESAADRSHGYAQVLLLVRLRGCPVGVSLLDVAARGQGAQYADRIWASARPAVQSRLAEIGAPTATSLEQLRRDSRVIAAWDGWLHEERRRVHEANTSVSVVVCTRGRPEYMDKCLNALCRLDYPNFEVVVVDNDPTNGELRALMDRRNRDDDCGDPSSSVGPRSIRYVEERRPGLSWARNRGLEVAQGELIAFTDDDALVEPEWLTALVSGFITDASVGCVTGMTLPAEIENRAQSLFEQFGGHAKGRGFVPERITAQGSDQHPLYPFPAYGAGVNMVFDAGILRNLGGFEPALGAGTPAQACEDTAAFARVLLAGHGIRYEPRALVHHFHRRDYAALKRQLHGYGVALTAYFLWCLLNEPQASAGLIGSVPRAMRYLFKRTEAHTATMGNAFPRDLMYAHRWGMLRGPAAYVRSLAQARRIARAYQS